MKDYEQLYYNTLYELKQIKKEKYLLEQEFEMYRSIQKNKDLKKVIVEEMLKYLYKERAKHDKNL